MVSINWQTTFICSFLILYCYWVNWKSLSSFCQARLFFHHPKFGILDECTKYVLCHNALLIFAFCSLCWSITVGPKFVLDCSATSVDVEEHLYRLATSMGITVITSSQVSIWTIPEIKFLMVVNCQKRCWMSWQFIHNLFCKMNLVLLKLFPNYRGLLWYPSMPWSWSSLTVKGTGSYVRSSSEWWYPLGVDAIKCTISCMYKSKQLAHCHCV